MAAIGLRLELTRQVLGMQQNEFCARAKIATNTYSSGDLAHHLPRRFVARRQVVARPPFRA
jgi:hypothetical protein